MSHLLLESKRANQAPEPTAPSGRGSSLTLGRRMNPRFLIFAFFAATLHAGETAETELVRLQHAMKSAMAQTDMNDASGELAKYWDRALDKEEAKVLASCDADRAKLFRSAQKAWREFRLAEAKLQGDFSR